MSYAVDRLPLGAEVNVFPQTLDRGFSGDYGTGFTDVGTQEKEAIQQTLAHNTDFGKGVISESVITHHRNLHHFPSPPACACARNTWD